MNSADVWWPENPDGDMTPILEESIAAFKARKLAEAVGRHPAGKGLSATVTPALTAADRCDSCGAAAVVAVAHEDAESTLMFCGHHHRRNADALTDSGWSIVKVADNAENLL